MFNKIDLNSIIKILSDDQKDMADKAFTISEKKIRGYDTKKIFIDDYEMIYNCENSLVPNIYYHNLKFVGCTAYKISYNTIYLPVFIGKCGELFIVSYRTLRKFGITPVKPCCYKLTVNHQITRFPALVYTAITQSLETIGMGKPVEVQLDDVFTNAMKEHHRDVTSVFFHEINAGNNV